MTPAELKAIRRKHSPTQAAFARALGYKASKEGTRNYRRYENGERPIPMLLQRLAEMIDRHGMPKHWKE